MEIIKIGLLILLTVFISGGIPTFSKEITVFITFSCCTVVLLYIINQVMPAIEYVKNIMESVDFYDIDIVLKSVGIGFVTQFVSDIALDQGNKTLSNQMVFAGRVCILMLAMPVFMEVFGIIERLAGNI